MNTLKRTRLMKDVSQGKLADSTGLSRQVISNLERGTSRGYPETWQRIAKALDVTVDELLDAPKAELPREQQLLQPAWDIEDSETDALARIVFRLSAWGKEIAASNAGSDELLRDLKFIDDMFEDVFRTYRTWEARGEETNDLARAIEALVSSSVDVREARAAAAAREADPEWKAEVSEFPKHRGSDESKDPQRAEAG